LVTGADVAWRLIHPPKNRHWFIICGVDEWRIDWDRSALPTTNLSSSLFGRGNSSQKEYASPLKIHFSSGEQSCFSHCSTLVKANVDIFWEAEQSHRRIYRVKHRYGLVRTSLLFACIVVRTKPYLCLTL
jgi:hypothetical protein